MSDPLLLPSSLPKLYITVQPCSTVSPRLTELAPLAGGTSGVRHHPLFFPAVWKLILVWTDGVTRFGEEGGVRGEGGGRTEGVQGKMSRSTFFWVERGV